MKFNIIICAIAGMAAFVSCGTSRKAASTEELISGSWNITEAMGHAVTPRDNAAPTISFDIDGKRVSGHAGCNRFMGGFTLNGNGKNSISFTPLAATKMMCPDMETEQNIFLALDAASRIKGSGHDSIEFRSDSGEVVLKMERQ